MISFMPARHFLFCWIPVILPSPEDWFKKRIFLIFQEPQKKNSFSPTTVSFAVFFLLSLWSTWWCLGFSFWPPWLIIWAWSFKRLTWISLCFSRLPPYWGDMPTPWESISTQPFKLLLSSVAFGLSLLLRFMGHILWSIKLTPSLLVPPWWVLGW